MFRSMLIVTLAIFLALTVGCSGGGGSSPVTPLMPSDNNDLSLTGNAIETSTGEDGHVLWGFWSIVLDVLAREFEVVPLRGASFHLNLSRLLSNAPGGLSVKINSLNIPNRLLDFDLTITHPVPDSNLRGFDVRGILMGPGETMAAQSDPSLVYCSLEGTRLINADGYTRWWNAVEFTDPGLFGYENNFVLPGFLVPTTTLNPYKYFSDPLGPNDPVVPGVNDENRGTFSTDGDPPSVTRNYQVRFPVINGNPKLGFHYAIDASYAPPVNGSGTPKPVEDFPPEANCPEPFHIEVNTDNSSVYYEGEASLGGHLVLDIEVFDWGAEDNPGGVNGEIDAIIIESPTLFDGMKLVDMTSMLGTQSTSSIFHITVPDVMPNDIEGQEVLVTVRSSYPTSYMPPIGSSDYPEQAALAAYTLVDIPVAVIKPSGFDSFITLENPKGGEYWLEGNMYEITWSASEDVENVIILLSNDSGQEYSTPITMSTPNDGSYLWFIDPSIDESNHCRLKITDVLPTELSDELDEDFAIFDQELAPIRVLYPNGGEIWKSQTVEEITWIQDPFIQNVKIELSTNDGADWPVLVTESTPSTGSFTWDTIPDIAVGEYCRIRISNVEDEMAYDVSNGNFSIKPMGDGYIQISTPVEDEQFQIGCSELVEWAWDGTISHVNILFKIDNVGTYSSLNLDVANIGWETITFEPEGIMDPAIWDSMEITGILKVESASDPAIFDEVGVSMPINLGILHEMVQLSDDGDVDADNIPDDVEMFIGTDPTDRDCDIPGPDSMFDNYEIFGNGYYDPYDLIPDEDQDGVIAPLDMDDNNDGVNDGESIDTDLDGIPNYLEYYGYTFNWMSGTFEKWDEESIDEPYFKTDPLQPSTDQDPYPDAMEVSGAFMDVSVLEPGDYPMVPAYPNIVIRLEGYDVTVNAEISIEEGTSIEQGTEWSVETSWEHGTEIEHNWEVGVEAGVEISAEPKVTITGHANYGGHWAETNSTAATRSFGGSITEASSWSRATSTNPTDAAHLRLYLKAYNYGTSCASNIVPTMTLKIGRRNIATFEPDTVINLLEPGGEYPAGADTYWVIGSEMSGPIVLTLDDLRALECGAPLTIAITQMSANVMLMNDSGQWESAGEWAEYMARCEAVCSNMYLEIGNGRFLHYLVYSDDSNLSPEVNFGDALIWVAGAGADPTDTWITYTDEFGIEQQISLDGWDFGFDPQTLMANGFTGFPLTPPDPEYNMADLVLNPESVIVGKIPREIVVGPDTGPLVIYAYLDEKLDTVRAMAVDYDGLERMEFIDKQGTIHDMYELIVGSGVYTFDLDPGYLSLGVEHVVAYSKKPPTDPLYTVHPVQTVFYPEVITTIPPTIRNVQIDLVNNSLYCQVVYDNMFPVTSVKAYHPQLPYAGSDFTKTPLWQGDPYGYFLTIPGGITETNYTDLIIEAVVSGGGYTAYKLSAQDLLKDYIEDSGTLFTYFKHRNEPFWDRYDYWRFQIANVDYRLPWGAPHYDIPSTCIVRYTSYVQSWPEYGIDEIFHGGGSDFGVRGYDPGDDGSKYASSHCWLFFTLRDYALYGGSGGFDDITLADCKAQTFTNGPGGIPICEWESGTAITQTPFVVILITNAGRYSKVEISSINVTDNGDWWPWYDHSSADISFRYVTFKTEGESQVWSHQTTELEAEVYQSSTASEEHIIYTTLDFDSSNTNVVQVDQEIIWDDAWDPVSGPDLWYRYYSGDGTDPMSPGLDPFMGGTTPGYIIFSPPGVTFDVEPGATNTSALTRLDVAVKAPFVLNSYFLNADSSGPMGPAVTLYLKTDEGRFAAVSLTGDSLSLDFDTGNNPPLWIEHISVEDCAYIVFKQPGDT